MTEQTSKSIVCFNCGDELDECSYCSERVKKGEQVVELYEDGHAHLGCALKAMACSAGTAEEKEDI